MSNPSQRRAFETDTVIIGRPKTGQALDLDLTPDTKVSRRHARLTYKDGVCWLEDLNSKYGTWLNEQRITVKTRLTPQETVQIGQTTLKVFVAIPPSTVKVSPPADNVSQTSPTGIVTDSINLADSSPTLLPINKPGQASLEEATQRRLDAFYELGAALSTVVAIEPLLEIVVEHLCQAVPDAHRGALLLQEEQGLAVRTHLPRQDQPSVSHKLANLAINKRAAFIWRPGTPGEIGQTPDSVILHGVECAMYAPLIWQEEVLGVVFVDNYESENVFTDDDLRLLVAMASQAAMFVKNHTLQQELRQEEAIRAKLLRQFSPKVAERLLQDRDRLQLGGQEAGPVTILVSDVRGFTTLSAQMRPNDVVALLNELFNKCVPIIFEYDGTIDKYIGDAILAVFGSPEADDEQWAKAVRAALELQQAVRELSDERQSRGLPVYQVGIGLHTGDILHGFIGSEERMEYTVIGDTVNRAVRYSDGADPGEIIISPAVYEQVQHLVEVEPRLIQSKHPDAEPHLEAYVIKKLKENVG